MKIAILFDTYLNNRKGLFNAIINRIKNLMAVADSCTIDLFCLQAQPAGLNKLLIKRHTQVYANSIQTDGLTINIVWYKHYLIDDILTNRFHKPSFMFKKWVKKNIASFSSYDIITAHSARCGEMARNINKKYGIPYFVTWHGTDIHTTPFCSPSLRQYVTKILNGAACNFFVSNALMKTAQIFTRGFKAEVLYNGVSEDFKTYDGTTKKSIREKYGLRNEKVVAFVGNVIPVKNVSLLPEIYSEVKRKYCEKVSFWIIGDGSQRVLVEKGMKEKNVDCVFWGNMPLDEMPNMMNCIDVLVLPSKKESFGLVLVEAIACGANAVGSRVGGIPEVIGEENTFELKYGFVTNISDRIVYFLTNNFKQVVKNKFSWKETAIKEYDIYNQVCLNYEKVVLQN